MPLKDALILTTVSGVTTLNVFLAGALTVAIPSIGTDLNIVEADLQWPLTVFSLAYGCTLLLFGRMGDIFGGRIMFLAGSAWFSIWSIGTALAPNLTSITIFLAMLGLGAAANTPAGIGIIASHFPAGPRRNTAFGILGAGQPLGYILGLVLGGILSESRATWRAIFYVQAGLGVLFVILGLFCLDKQPTSDKLYSKGLDWGGALLSTAGLGLLTYSLAASSSAPRGWATPYIIGLICASVVLLALFWFYEMWREKKSLSVLMPPSIWKHPSARMPATIGMVFFAWWNFNTLLYLCALYYQQVNGLSPLETSIRFLPSIICGVATNLAGGWLMNRVSGLPLILGAVTMNMVAALLFSLLDVNAGYWKISLWVMVLLAGADLIYPAGTLQVSSAFDNDSKSLAGGIFTVATRIGASLGTAVTTSISTGVSRNFQLLHPELPSTDPQVLMVGFRAGAWSLFAAAVISFAIALIGLRGIGIIGRSSDTKKPDPVEPEPKPEPSFGSVETAV
ncbi:major facilitator superfamily-domain-containing protein [Mycena albidolilacea]|uniref:Major facilitator superfamily-domain-containing protein n=1 Tax=Mycena albidolilacea TaxID=1033008 RepID=A0AAD6ZMP3_9AGAR|nr:major facilitator superfamily-domain-containing protein [Mycena albidolilacea]